MRLFIALSLPEPVRARLCELELGLPGARWVAPENLHLTLSFLGEVDDRQARDLEASLSRVRAARFPMSLSGVGRFGSARNPRTLWVGVKPEPALDRLYREVDRAVQAAGRPPEGRGFSAHVTLARFKTHPGRRLDDYLTDHATFHVEAFPVAAFVLYSSSLSGGKPIHTQEVVYPLASALERGPRDPDQL